MWRDGVFRYETASMKLLFVHEKLGAHGGAETDLRLTAQAMSERGHTTGLLFERGSGKNEDRWEQCFSWRSQLPAGRTTGAVQASLEEFDPDLVYYYSLPDEQTLAVLLESGIPLARRVQDHALYCMRGYKYNFLSRAICTRGASTRCLFPCLAFVGRNRDGGFPLKWVSYGARRREIALSRRCRRLIVYSEYQKAELLRNGFDPARIVQHVPLNFQGARGPRSTMSGRNLVVFAGQIIRGKGVDLLLRALAKVRAPFECVILGEGSARAGCEKLCAALGLGERVRFHGFVPAEAMRAFYQEASVAVMSSVWPEPFGMAGPEAMLYGLPVVAFDAGGIREWLQDGENGFLAPWMDTDQFAARLEQLLLDKELARRLGNRAREQAASRFDPEHQFNLLDQTFRRIVEEERAITDQSCTTTDIHEFCC